MKTKVPGIKFIKDSRGKARYIQFDLKKTKERWYQMLEDIIDTIDVENSRAEGTVDFNKFVKAENKRRGIKKIEGIDL